MKKIARLFAMAAAVAAASCQRELPQDETVPQNDGVLNSIEAYTDGTALKSFLDENIEIMWNSGDAISVFDGASNKEFTTEDEGAKAVFNYYGTLSKEESFYALYPYDASASISGNVISTTIPTTQTAVAGSFGRGANLSVGYTTYCKEVTFRNALAYAKVSFKSEAGAKISKIVFRSLDESVLLSGKANLTVTVEDGGVTGIEAVVTDGVPYAEVVAAEGEFLQSGVDYYIAVAPRALTGGYQIEFVDEDGLVLKKTYDSDTYKAAELKRNNIAPTGRKNIDNIEVEGWYRVHNANLEKANHPGAGNYLVVKKMDDGSYRILDENGSDTYILKGTSPTGTNCFELSGTNMISGGDYQNKQMESVVAFVFRNAWVSSSDATSGITKANDEVIIGNGNIGIDVDSYVSGRDTYYYANIILYNRHDNKQITVTLDKLGCTLTSDEGFVKGCFNRTSLSTNSNGNPDTCTDLVDALMLHATFNKYGIDFTETVKNTAVEQIKGDDNEFTGGYSTKVYSNAYTAMGGKMNYSNHFMITTSALLSRAEASPVTLYKKDTKKYSEYLTIK